MIRMVARGGHNLLMFWITTWQLRVLNALEATTRKIASLSSFSNTVHTAYTAASMPEIWAPLTFCRFLYVWFDY